MDIQITPHALSGSVTPPSSKSMAHRRLFAAALSQGESLIRGVTASQDVEATIACLTRLGAAFQQSAPDVIRVRGVAPDADFEALPQFDCGESGSTLRFLIPVALAVAGGGIFTGRGRLMERPQQPYFDLFDKKGIAHSLENGVLTVRGALAPGAFALPGNVSSQFFTGLLFALSLLDGESTLESTTPLESAAYVDMTVAALRDIGGAVEVLDAGRYRVSPARLHCADSTVEADWSQAAFWYASSFLTQPLQIENLDNASAQGDRVIAQLYWKLAKPGDVEIDLSGCPDLLPPLAVMAAARRGTTRFVGAARLRLKESDRLKTTAAMVNALGGQAEELAEGLVLRGIPTLSGGTVDGAGDHRIVMAAAIAATACANPVTILGAEAVNKSYPSFFQEFERLGGLARVI